VKLLLNMLMIGAGAIPRGGTLKVDPAREGEGAFGFQITASGLNARLTPTTAELLAGSPAHAVDAHGIQPLYTGILARDCGLALSAGSEGEVVVLTAR
jgi:histidine phosphotransferase ChpT